MIEKFSVRELSGWRTNRISAVLMKSVEKRCKQYETELKQAAVDGTLDRVRRLSGCIEALDWVMATCCTEGTPDDDEG